MKAYDCYAQACQIESADYRCRKKMDDIMFRIKGETSSPSQQNQSEPTSLPPPSVDEAFSGYNVDQSIQHTIRYGETLSDIAMYYYDTYKTQVYFVHHLNRFMTMETLRKLPDISRPRKYIVGNMADALRKINGLKVRNLPVSQRIIIPTVEGLPFIHKTAAQRPIPRQTLSSGSPSIANRRQTTMAKPFKAKPTSPKPKQPSPHPEPPPPSPEPSPSPTPVPPIPENKPAKDPIPVRSLLSKTIEQYHRAEFNSARISFQKLARPPYTSQTQKLAMIYLSLIEMASGNWTKTDNYLRQLFRMDKDFGMDAIRDIRPASIDDITPDLLKRMEPIRQSAQSGS